MQHASTRHTLLSLGPSAAAARTSPERPLTATCPVMWAKFAVVQTRSIAASQSRGPIKTVRHAAATRGNGGIFCRVLHGQLAVPGQSTAMLRKRKRIFSVSPVAYVRMSPGQSRECSIHRQTRKVRTCGLTSARVSQAHQERRDTTRHRQIENYKVQHAHQPRV